MALPAGLGLPRVFRRERFPANRQPSPGPLFGLCAALSPSLWWCRGRLLREVAADGGAWLRPVCLWIDMGTCEGDGGRRTRVLVRHLESAGLRPGEHFRYEEVKGGEHNESAWAARFDRVLLYLFGTAT